MGTEKTISDFIVIPPYISVHIRTYPYISVHIRTFFAVGPVGLVGLVGLIKKLSPPGGTRQREPPRETGAMHPPAARVAGAAPRIGCYAPPLFDA